MTTFGTAGWMTPGPPETCDRLIARASYLECAGAGRSPNYRAFVHAVTRIGNNDGVTRQIDSDCTQKFSVAAISELAGTARSAQIELGGSIRWRR